MAEHAPLRNKVIIITMSAEEKALAEQEAQKLGMPLTSFIRLLIKNFADGITFAKDEKK